MNDRQLETVKQVGEFLAGTEIVEFSIESAEGRYAFIHATLRKFRYGHLGKAEKGLIGHSRIPAISFSYGRTARRSITSGRV